MTDYVGYYPPIGTGDEWERGSTGGYVHTGATPPSSPNPWDVWWCDDPAADHTGLYVYYRSAAGLQWVEMVTG